jgi:Ca2+-binding RTX toxin-like protein
MQGLYGSKYGQNGKDFSASYVKPLEIIRGGFPDDFDYRIQRKQSSDATHTVRGQPLPTDGADIVNGNNGNDNLSGLGGNDAINGGAGNDTMRRQ